MNLSENIGIVLSGGGARGISHLGALQAINEWGIRPKLISGTSAGAIVGALYAAGQSPAEILNFITKTNILRYFKPATNFTGLLRLEKTAEAFRLFLAEDNFESLKIPLFVNATDIERGETVFFHSGELIKPLQASSCIPFLFEPVEIDGRYYIDGGILNNLPVEPLVGRCDYIIGIHSNAVSELKISNMKQVIERTFHLVINANITSRKPLCHLFIEPPEMAAYKVFDVAKAREIFDVGYKHTRQVLAQAVRKLQSTIA
ncbi:MAG: patatin-like phospholipase family protein [Cytophagales bacterium]|nr:patatin-like phospholipase family protein [Bernardetiaceae bacterium]MDW8205423.1 patatin-like phospholipase family protein [Cytophagales bacterium]